MYSRLKANYKGREKKISYDLNGGTLGGKTGVVEVSASYGDNITLPKPSRDGYTFSYWKVSRYKAGASYKVKEDHTFVAQWKKDSGVDTGDENILTLWIATFILSMALLAVIAALRLRRRQ